MSRPFAARRQDANRRALVYAKPPSFGPMSIGNAFLWLRSDMGVTLAGAKVGAVADQSGLGNDFVQAVDGSRFGYVASDANFNGKPSFTLSGGWMASVAPVAAGFANVTVVGVWRPTNVASGLLLETGASFGTQDIQLSYSRWSTYVGGAAGFDRAQMDVNDTANVKQHFASTMPFGSLATDGPANYRAGALVASTMSTNTGTNTTLATKTWNIGARTGGVGPAGGSLVELIAYSKILTVAQLLRLYTDYTLPRYGTQGT